MSFDMNALLKQAQEMQEQMQQMQEDAAKETASASAGGGMVTVVATAAGEITELKIDPKAIDPSDPELLADMVMAATNEALRAAHAKVEAKMKSMLPPDLGGLLRQGYRRELHREAARCRQRARARRGSGPRRARDARERDLSRPARGAARRERPRDESSAARAR